MNVLARAPGAVDLTALQDAVGLLESAVDVLETDMDTVEAHVATTTGNPHGVSATDVGLGNCDNTADADKPISTAAQTALDTKLNNNGDDAIDGRLIINRDSIESLSIRRTLDTEYGGVAFRTEGFLNWVLAMSNDESGDIYLQSRNYDTDGGVRSTIFTVDWASGVIDMSETPTKEGNTIWHAGNDGAGSGLDADTVDGVEASALLNHNVIDSPTDADTTPVGYFDAGMAVSRVQAGNVNYPSQYGTLVTNYYNDLRCFQMFVSLSGPQTFYFRAFVSGSWRPWAKVLNDGDMGAGSELDADTVDGLEASQFLRADTDDNINSDVAISFGGNAPGAVRVRHNASENRFYMAPRNSTGDDWEWTKEITYDSDLGYWNIEGSPRADGYEILTTADEGSGNGLDADTVDSLEASQFLRSDAADELNVNNNANPLTITRANASNHQVSIKFKTADAGESTVYEKWLGISSGDFYISDSANLFVDGNKIITTADAGTGNGLDADTVDGLEGNQFLRSDADQSYPYYLQVLPPSDVWSPLSQFWISAASGGLYTGGSYATTLTSNAYRNSSGTMSFLGASGIVDGGSTIDLHPDGRIMFYGGTYSGSGTVLPKLLELSDSVFEYEGNKIWHAGNDGSGSNLDADTVDGVEASQLVRNDTTYRSDTRFWLIEGSATKGWGVGKDQTTGLSTDQPSLRVDRYADHTGGTTGGSANPSALSVTTTVGSDVENYEVGATMTIDHEGGISGQNIVGMQAEGRKNGNGGATTFGGNIVAKDLTGNASATSGGNLIGLEVTMRATGADTTTSRIALDTVLKAASSPSTTSYHCGIRVRPGGESGNYSTVNNGLVIEDGDYGAVTNPISIRTASSGGHHILVTAKSTSGRIRLGSDYGNGSNIISEMISHAYDSGSNWTDYTNIRSVVVDDTNGSEDGRLDLIAKVGGSDQIFLQNNATGTTDGVKILVNGSLKTIQAGAADSAGTGYRLLRITN